VTTQLAVTMDELELEHAELLPSRETLCCVKHCGCGSYSSFNFTQIGGSTYQAGLLNVAALNGNNIAIL